MSKLALILFATTLICLLFTKPANAATQEAGSSAVLRSKVVTEVGFDYREHVLRKFLAKNNSPLTPYSLEFIKMADYYNLDWRMVPAISGVESTFGKRIPKNSYNAYGWAGGKYAFKSWPNSIQVVSMTLKTKYINKGATSVSKIAHIYAPPSTTWAHNVKFFVNKITPMPLSFDI